MIPHTKEYAFDGSDFAENAFPRMNEVIVNCLREYEAEQQRGS